MKTVLFKAVCSDPAVSTVLDALAKKETPILMTGLGHIHRAVTAGVLSRTTVIPIILTGDEADAAKLTDDLKAMDIDAVLFPAREITLGAMRSSSREYEQQRLCVLGRLVNGAADCVVASAEAASQLTLPPDTLLMNTIDIVADRPLPVDNLAATLISAGYERCDKVESAGQFAIRGGITDIFPASESAPIRLELWGDTVDTLSYFDVDTQRRTESVSAVSISPAVELLCDNSAALADRLTALASSLRGKQAPAKEWLTADAAALKGGGHVPLDKYLPLLYDAPATLFDYLPNSVIVACEWSRLLDQFHAASWRLSEELSALLEEARLCKTLDRFMLEEEELTSLLSSRQLIVTENFTRSVKSLPLRTQVHAEARQLPPVFGHDRTA